ncbi:hypothetical protein ACFC1R_38400 [Kitasatospora sp. NPDC056138]|uniref:hypothetical protein n=1 Tax=Kitasatospora sp. NPDC056138 TaxID=3345724 RepID=UPI0035E24033
MNKDPRPERLSVRSTTETSPAYWALLTGIPAAVIDHPVLTGRPRCCGSAYHNRVGKPRFAEVVTHWEGTNVRAEVIGPSHPRFGEGPADALHGALPDAPHAPWVEPRDSWLFVRDERVRAVEHRAAGLVGRACTWRGWTVVVVTELRDERDDLPRVDFVFPYGRTTFAAPGNIAHHLQGHRATANSRTCVSHQA